MNFEDNFENYQAPQQMEQEPFQDYQNDFQNAPQFLNPPNELGDQPLEPEQFRKVFIGGLSYKTDDDTFKEYFSKFGDLVDYVVMKDKESGKSRGFGFVTYSNSSMVDELMKNRPHIIDGRQIEPKRATPREDSGKHEVQATVKKLFIGGVKDNITEIDLKNYFSNYGNITDVVIMKDKEKNTTRGFGFVTFDDYDPVDKIIIEKHHTINGINLHTQKALPKDGQNAGGQNRQQNNRGPPNNNQGGFNNMSRNGGGGGGRGGGNQGFQMNAFNNMNNNSYGSYNQAPMAPRRGGGGGGGVGGGNGGGPMRGGRFGKRSQGPYGGQNGNRGQRGGRGLGQRGGRTLGGQNTQTQQF